MFALNYISLSMEFGAMEPTKEHMKILNQKLVVRLCFIAYCIKLDGLLRGVFLDKWWRFRVCE